MSNRTHMAIVCLLTISAVANAIAQDRPASSRERPDPPEGFRDRGHPRHGDAPPRPRGEPGAMPDARRRLMNWADLAGAGLLRPAPDEWGPIRPGEEQRLMEFARRNMPGAYSLLTQAQQRNPQMFERRLQMIAPRLRHFERISGQYPDFARALVGGVESDQALAQAVGDFRRAPQNSPQRQPAETLLRQRIAARLDAQEQIGRQGLEILSQEREQRAAAIADQLLANPDRLPPDADEIRERIERIRSATDDAEREALESAFRTAVSQRYAQQLERMQEHVQHLAERRAARIEAGMQRIQNGEDWHGMGDEWGSSSRPTDDDR
ncbi:MAG: hypothetical protein U1D55_15105 [Phycisphaerae bacterium]